MPKPPFPTVSLSLIQRLAGFVALTAAAGAIVVISYTIGLRQKASGLEDDARLAALDCLHRESTAFRGLQVPGQGTLPSSSWRHLLQKNGAELGRRMGAQSCVALLLDLPDNAPDLMAPDDVRAMTASLDPQLVHDVLEETGVLAQRRQDSDSILPLTIILSTL